MSMITLLDGSIGQELVKRGGGRPTPLWSTSVMMEQPDLVGDVHRAYFNAGATIATTNTYAVHRNRLKREGLESNFAPLLTTAVDQACTARDAHTRGRIAGGLGPFLASYRPDLTPDAAEAAAGFEEMVNLIGPRVDLLLIETVSSVLEAKGALQGTENSGKPVWIAFTVQDDDGRFLRSGELLSDVEPLIAQYNPEAVLINCSRPEAFPAALQVIKPFGRPFGGYANGFTFITSEFLEDAPTVDALQARQDLTPAAYADHAMRWVDIGATIIGGCCEVGPDHIAELSRRLHAGGHTIV